MDIVLSIKQIGGNVVDQVKGKMASLKKMTDGINLAQITGAIGVVKSLGTYVQAYEESRRATSMLSNSLKNVGVDYQTVKDEVEKTTKALQDKTNFGDDEQVQALSRLVPLVGSYEKAITNLPKMLDLAAFQQSDLKSATDDYAKLLKGELPIGLGRVIPELRKMKEEGASSAQMIELLNQKIKGSAEADVSPLIQFKNILGDIAEEIGEMLLPPLKMLKDAFVALPGFMQKIIVLAPLLGGAFMAMGGPVTLVAGAVGALVIAFGKLYQSYNANKKAWEETQNALKGTANEANGAGKNIKAITPYVYDLGVTMDLSKVKIEKFEEAMAQANVTEEQRQKMRKAWRKANHQQTKEELKEEKDAIKEKLANKEYFAIKEQEYRDKRDNFNIEKDIAIREKERISQDQKLANMKYANEQMAKMDEERIAKATSTSNDLSQIGMAVGMAMSAGIGKGAEGMKESLKAVLNLGLDFLQNKLLTATASAIFDGIMTMGTSIPGHLAALAAGTIAIQGARVGIEKFEAGTNYAGGGLAMVGERGPELINMPRGASVMNHTQTMQAINNNAAPSVVIIKQNTDRGLQKQLERMTRNKTIDWSRIMAMA